MTHKGKAATVTEQNGIVRVVGVAGRKSLGLYPHLSRTLIAEALGVHKSSVSGYLKGRTQVPFKKAILLARLVGVTVGRLQGDLEGQRRKWEEGTWRAKRQ